MDGPATVYIPRTLTASFIQYEDTIARSYVPDVSTPAPVTYASVTKGSSKSYTHVVRSGESLGLIAQRNSVSIQDLRRWNHLHGDRIRAGQRLLLHHEVVPEPVTTTKEPDEAKAVPASPGATEYIYHTVQPGDTLWGIAQNYPGVSLDDLKRLNANMNFRHLTVGEKIKVGVEKG
jgi:membrane-bound lytic murein transglycosylase D